MEIGFRETFRTASILRQGKLLRLQRALPEGGGDDDLEFTAISGSLNPEVEPRHPEVEPRHPEVESFHPEVEPRHPEVEPRYPEAKPLSKKKRDCSLNCVKTINH